MSQPIPVTIRFPLDVHGALHEAQAQDDRSFNGEVIAMLRIELTRRGFLSAQKN